MSPGLATTGGFSDGRQHDADDRHRGRACGRLHRLHCQVLQAAHRDRARRCFHRPGAGERHAHRSHSGRRDRVRDQRGAF